MKRIINYLFFIIACSLVVACGNSKTNGTAGDAIEETSGDEAVANPVELGQAIYISNCKLCHGQDGTLGASGAANLQKSVLKTQDLNNVITYGKNNMTGYKGLLEPKDIEHVVAYIETLRK